MKRLTSIISLVCIVAVCFTLFAACSQSVDKVKDYVEDVKKADNFIVIQSEEDADSIFVTEYEFSNIKDKKTGDVDMRMHIKSLDNPKKETEQPKMTNENKGYYEKLLNDDVYYHATKDGFYVYSRFLCTNPKHIKNKDNFAVEWKKEKQEDMTEDYIKEQKDVIKSILTEYNIDSDKLEYSKDKKGFVYKKGNEVEGVNDMVMTIKFGKMTINFKKPNGNKCYIAFRCINTAQVTFPALPDESK